MPRSLNEVRRVSATDDGHDQSRTSVTVDSKLALTVTVFTITDKNGQAVPTTLGADALTTAIWANWAVATPNAVLRPSTSYTVNFKGSRAASPSPRSGRSPRPRIDLCGWPFGWRRAGKRATHREPFLSVGKRSYTCGARAILLPASPNLD